MSFTRAVPPKHSNISTTLPTLPKLPSRLQPKRPIIPSNTSKIEIKIQLSSNPNKDDLDDMINNLSTVVKQSEKLLTPKKSSHTTNTVRRTSSLHITNRENLSQSFVKTSNSHHDTLINSNSDLSRLNLHRRSLRNVEKFSGIKCSLPTGTLTMPNTCKGLEKHSTPTKNTSLIDTQITPTATNAKVKSPWRLRFEKFLNHQELTPLSPTNESIAFTTAKTSSMNKENRTPSFRHPIRKIYSISNKN